MQYCQFTIALLSIASSYKCSVVFLQSKTLSREAWSFQHTRVLCCNLLTLPHKRANAIGMLTCCGEIRGGLKNGGKEREHGVIEVTWKVSVVEVRVHTVHAWTRRQGTVKICTIWQYELYNSWHLLLPLSGIAFLAKIQKSIIHDKSDLWHKHSPGPFFMERRVAILVLLRPVWCDSSGRIAVWNHRFCCFLRFEALHSLLQVIHLFSLAHQGAT